MWERLSPIAIIIGIIISQTVAMVLVWPLIIALFYIYQGSIMVAFFQNPSVIIATMLVSLITIICGGYGSMLATKKYHLNSAIFGAITLALNVLALYAIEFKYAVGHEWILVITGMLIIPSALMGSYLYKKLHS